ncbi:methyl-accepting chemotaxis protein [Zhaonella formicivorans]|uniref:methyl-accepting chemotaxis protein n=1 Tax=Zhaonella formicivorans TaxID=2528593 RepID=UPI0010E8EFBE|nr:methyl-accepting chemotaxis protein [Zhaonella formicivorans]
MPSLAEQRLLKSKLAKNLLKKTKILAGKCEKIIAESNSIEAARDKLRDLFNSNLDRGESLVIVNYDGLALVHVNKLREGMLLNDPAGLKAAQCKSELLQILEQNTGQLMLDAAVPINVNGKRTATLRIGKEITSGKILYHLLFATLLPILVYILLDLCFKDDITSLFLGIVPLFIAALSSIFLYRMFQTVVQDVKIASKTIATGDLTSVIKPKIHNELGNMICEMNKVSLGLKTILQELEQVVAAIGSIGRDQILATQEMSKAINEVSSSIENIAGGSANQAADIEQIKQFASILTSSLNKMAKTSSESVQLALTVEKTAQENTWIVEETIRQMQAIYNSVVSSSRALGALESSSQEIGAIVNTITAIAEQTNLLALNAAIEAARAGEQGRGFAVVAEEVRKLAVQSNIAAKNIMSIISKTQATSSEAANAMRRASEQVESGMQVIETLNSSNLKTMDTIKGITLAIESNNSLAEQIKNNSLHLEKDINNIALIASEAAQTSQSVVAIVQEQNAMSQEIAAGAEHIGKEIEKLLAIISRFKLK